MIKNMTRKGLAIGATAALTLAGLVGIAAPANASAGMVLKANTGTILAVPVTETLTLSASLVPSLPAANIQQLKYRVVTDGSYVLRAELNSADTTANNEFFTNTTGGPKGSSAVGTGDWIAADIQTSKVLTPHTTPTTVHANTLALSVDATRVGTTADGIAPTKATATRTATVTAWLDSNNNGVVDADEVQQTVTVSFVKYSELATSTTIVAPVEGDTTVEARLAFTNVNNEQLTAAKVGVHFTKGDDSNLDAAPAKIVKSAVAWDATNGYFKYVTDSVAALDKTEAVKVQPLFKSSAIDTANLTDAGAEKVGTAVTAAIAARKAATIVASTVASTTANASNAVLLNSAWKVKAVVKDGTADTNPVAGNAVTATVTTTAALAPTSGAVVSLTVNGTTHTSTATLPGAGSVAKLALTTDANGEVFVDLAAAGFTAGNNVVVSFVTENLSAATVTNVTAAATYTATVRPFFTTTDGAAVAVPVVVYDQFGGVPADKYDVRATFNDTLSGYVAQATIAATVGSNAVAQLVGGKATLSILDNGTGLGVNTYAVTVQERLAGNDYGANVVGTVQTNVHIKSAESLVAGSVTSNGTLTNGVYVVAGTVALSLVDLANYDSVTVVDTAPTAFTNALTAQAITGTVSTASSATLAATAVPGASVTLSGAGLQFGDGAGKFSANSITVHANTSGVYTANVYSHKAGKQTVTVTSGGASSVVEITFAAAASNTGANVSVAITNAVAGSTMKVVTTITDKFGNPVKSDLTTVTPLTIVYDGPGFIVGGDTPSATLADGTATFNVFLGNNDVVTGSVTVTYSGVDRNLATAADNITTVANIGAAAAGTSRGWTRFLSATDELKIYARDVVGAGKVQFMVNGKELAWIRAVDATDPKLNVASDGMVRSVFVSDMLVGKNVIEIYEDGVRIARRIYTR